MEFTYNDQDEQRILFSITDPIIKRLVEMLFDQACNGPGLSKQEFDELEQLIAASIEEK
jgi:hypothetical protein